MMVARSSSFGDGSPESGSVFSMTSFQVGTSRVGDSGRVMRRSSVGMPGAMASKPSSLPMKISSASLCSRICRMLSAVSVG